jgi:ABC-2 type transport system ATP-binding protein
VRLLGHDATRNTRRQRAVVGLVPSGDRSFYLRISGIENLVFFGRLHGLRHRAARRRALAVLEAVGLEDAGSVRVGEYSHGMQKRLSVARALLTDPRVLLVDEATHDLDPHAARVVRELVERLAAEGAAVVWATQRIDEIRGFARSVTLLREGQVCYAGTVTGLTSLVRVTSHVVRLRSRIGDRPALVRLRHQLAQIASIDAVGDDPELFVLELSETASLGDALATLMHADVDVLSCREVRSELEEAFVQLTGRP